MGHISGYKQVCIYMRPELRNEANALADHLGISFYTLVDESIKLYIKRNAKGADKATPPLDRNGLPKATTLGVGVPPSHPPAEMSAKTQKQRKRKSED